jgi:hypothetical protein
VTLSAREIVAAAKVAASAIATITTRWKFLSFIERAL